MWNLVFALVCLLVFAILWIGFQYLCSQLGGWAMLAQAYRSSRPFVGQIWQAEDCRLLRMKWESYISSLRAYFPALPLDLPDEVFSSTTQDLHLGANRQGLYLASTRLSRFRHPPLFVPWEDMAIIGLQYSWAEFLAQARLGFTNSKTNPESDFGFEWLAFRFRRAPLVVLLVDEENADRVAAAAGDAWPGFQSVSPLNSGAELKNP